MIEVGRLWRCLVLLEVTSVSSVWLSLSKRNVSNKKKNNVYLKYNFSGERRAFSLVNDVNLIYNLI